MKFEVILWFSHLWNFGHIMVFSLVVSQMWHIQYICLTAFCTYNGHLDKLSSPGKYIVRLAILTFMYHKVWIVFFSFSTTWCV